MAGPAQKEGETKESLDRKKEEVMEGQIRGNVEKTKFFIDSTKINQNEK